MNARNPNWPGFSRKMRSLLLLMEADAGVEVEATKVVGAITVNSAKEALEEAERISDKVLIKLINLATTLRLTTEETVNSM